MNPLDPDYTLFEDLIQTTVQHKPKEEIMAKNTNKVISQDEFEAALKSEVPVYDKLAITILPKDGGGYNIVKILVDSKCLTAKGAVEVVDTAESRSEASEKFKLLVVRNGII